MGHTIEPAASGRAKCRGCGELIAKGVLRFGERLENPFADGEMTIWFHLLCAAYRRPESMVEFLAAGDADIPEELQAELKKAAGLSLLSHRACRLGKAERASSGRARCRHCREPIAKDSWRLPLMYFEEGVFNTSGFVHADCIAGYTGSTALAPLVDHFCNHLSPEDRNAVVACVQSQTAA